LIGGKLMSILVGLGNMLTKYYNVFTTGVINTIVLSIFTILLGIIGGIILSLMKLSGVKPLKMIASAYVEFIRGTPILVQLYLVFYGLPMMGINLPQINFNGVDVTRLFSGVVALSINSSAYICEIIRSGVQSVNHGQTEAARSLGLDYKITMRYVIMPQAFKNILPALGNEFITIIKGSSIISVIGVSELMYSADVIKGITFEPFTPLIIIAIIYFIITYSISKLLQTMENRLKVSER
jgi:polar amino acid transport system permease protein